MDDKTPYRRTVTSAEKDKCVRLYMQISDQVIQPGEMLRPFVKHYWIFRSASANETIFPSGAFDMAIRLNDGNGYTVINEQRTSIPGIEILGQLTTPAILETSQPVEMLIIRFYPQAASYFVPDRLTNFTNRSVDATQVFPDDLRSLQESIRESKGIQQCIYMVEQFLMRRLGHNRKNPDTLALVNVMCNLITARHDPFPVNLLSQKTGYSKRYLQRIFRDHVGVTLKTFYKINRFNKSIQLLAGSNTSLTSLSYDCGYADQSHFIKDFRTFSGTTPAKFKRASNQ